MSSHLKRGKSDYSNRKVTIVLGGGLLLDGGLPSHVIKRLDKAIEIFRDHTIFVCSSIFTLNKPQVLKDGFDWNKFASGNSCRSDSDRDYVLAQVKCYF